MKQIVFLFFTFSGICPGFAQKPGEIIDSTVNNQNIINKDAEIEKKDASIRLYPNPAKNKIEIAIKGFDAGFVQIQLIDKHGHLVRNDKRLLYNGNEIVVFMFSENPGLYYVLVKQGEKTLKSKLIIQ